jgi:hypothetical protein
MVTTSVWFAEGKAEGSRFVMGAADTVNAPAFVAVPPSGFVTVKLYVPAVAGALVTALRASKT